MACGLLVHATAEAREEEAENLGREADTGEASIPLCTPIHTKQDTDMYTLFVLVFLIRTLMNDKL